MCTNDTTTRPAPRHCVLVVGILHTYVAATAPLTVVAEPVQEPDAILMVRSALGFELA